MSSTDQQKKTDTSAPSSSVIAGSSSTSNDSSSSTSSSSNSSVCCKLFRSEDGKERLWYCIVKFVYNNSMSTIILSSSILSVSLSYIKPNVLVEHRYILRPLLNISWGYLFGSGLWAGHIGGMFLRRHYNRHLFGDIQSKNFATYFSLSSLASAVLLCSTVSLAPRNKVLLYGATCSLLTNVLNHLFLSKKIEEYKDKKNVIEDKYNLGKRLYREAEDEKSLKEISKDEEYTSLRNKFKIFHTSGMICTYLGVAGLIPYIFV